MELLVRTVDKEPGESASKRGDVIAANSDGFGWSQAERNNPEWVILIAEITDVEAESLLTPPLAWEGVTLRRYAIDLDGLAGDTLSRAELMTRLVQR